MIKAVIFDVGGVLVRTTDHSFRHFWEKKLGLAPGQSEEIVFNSEMGILAQKGKVTDEALWSWVGEYLNLGDQLQDFRTSFWRGDELDKQLMDYIQTLRPGYQTAIISNATDVLHDNLTNKFRIADAFDLIIGSAEVKTMKPDAAIYSFALRGLNRKADECVYIDDFIHNVEAARAVGMSAIHFTSNSDIPTELAGLGVQPDADKEI